MKYYVVYTGTNFPEGSNLSTLPSPQRYFEEIECEQPVDSILALAEEIRTRRGFSELFIENIIHLQDEDIRLTSLETLLQEALLIDDLSPGRKPSPGLPPATENLPRAGIDPIETAGYLRKLADSLEEPGVIIETVEKENYPVVVRGPDGSVKSIRDSGQRRLTLVWHIPAEDGQA